jgi:glycosyltransferase involved in cell wall biosynthesis
MKKQKQKILIVGLFLSQKNKSKILRTAADQLSELLHKNNIPVIKISDSVNPVTRFADTISGVIRNVRKYKIGIVPLYGGLKSYVWQSAATKLLKFLNKKVILIVHGGSIPSRMKKHPERYLKSFRRADVVVVPSAYIASTLKDYDVKTELIENVVNLDNYHFHYKENFRPRLLWMRTLEDIYNPEMAVRVAAIIAKEYPEMHMVMAGYDRGSLAMVQQLAKDLGVADKIDFPGYINNQQKNEYAAELDIYICTNRVDNAPVTFIEMMALGLPIVSVNVGGIPFLLKEEVNGLMVDLDDDDAMAKRIISIINQPYLGRELASNARQFAKRFGEKPVLEKWKVVLKRLGYK